MTNPAFRTIRPATPESVLEEWREVLWKLAGIGLQIGHADSAMRSKISVPYGMLVEAFQGAGGELGPCPWVKNAPKTVGKANPGIV